MSHIPMAYNQLVDSSSVYEVELDEDLAQFGIPPLPSKFIRQTPGQALRSSHFWVNYIISVLCNWGANTGVGVLMIGGGDEVGLWEKPPSNNPYNGAIWSDFIVTCFLITFLNTWIASWGVGLAVSKAQAIPIDNRDLAAMPWTVVPVRIRSIVGRGLMLAFANIFVYFGVSIFLLFLICNLGGFHSTGEECSMASQGYIYFKGVWAAGTVAMCYPVVYCASLNRKYLETENYEKFLVKAKEKADREAKGIQNDK